MSNKNKRKLSDNSKEDGICEKEEEIVTESNKLNNENKATEESVLMLNDELLNFDEESPYLVIPDKETIRLSTT